MAVRRDAVVTAFEAKVAADSTAGEDAIDLSDRQTRLVEIQGRAHVAGGELGAERDLCGLEHDPTVGAAQKAGVERIGGPSAGAVGGSGRPRKPDCGTDH